MIALDRCQKITIPRGFLYIGPYDKQSSVGYLELNPHQSLTLHNRSAPELDEQIKGVSEMIVYWPKGVEVIVLKPGEKVKMVAETWHIHCNPYDKISLTYWEFDGDITQLISEILSNVGE